MTTINDALRAHVADLEEGGVVAPLAQCFTLANLWYDLAKQVGEVPPPDVLALVDAPLDIDLLPGAVADAAWLQAD